MKALRKRLGAKQVDLARAFGVKPLTILRWEKAPNLPKLVRLALTAWVHGLPAWPDEYES